MCPKDTIFSVSLTSKSLRQQQQERVTRAQGHHRAGVFDQVQAADRRGVVASEGHDAAGGVEAVPGVNEIEIEIAVKLVLSYLLEGRA